MTTTLLLLALTLAKPPAPSTNLDGYQDPSVTKRLRYHATPETIAKWVFDRIEECDSSGLILTVVPEGLRAECVCPEIMLSNAHDPIEYRLNPNHKTTPHQKAIARANQARNAVRFHKTIDKAFAYKPKAKRPKKTLAKPQTNKEPRK